MGLGRATKPGRETERKRETERIKILVQSPSCCVSGARKREMEEGTRKKR